MKLLKFLTKKRNKKLIDENYKETVSYFLISFWITIFLTRSILFGLMKYLDISPGLVIKGTHIHHFVFGFIIIFVFLMIYLKDKEFFILPLLSGIGTALVVDEFPIIFNAKNFDYWGIENFFGILIGGSIIVTLCLIINKKKYKKDGLFLANSNIFRKKSLKYLLSVFPFFILIGYLYTLFYFAKP